MKKHLLRVFRAAEYVIKIFGKTYILVKKDPLLKPIDSKAILMYNVDSEIISDRRISGKYTVLL